MIENIPIPNGFKDLMAQMLGPADADTLFLSLDSEPEIAIRLNVNKFPTKRLYEDMTEVPWCRSAFYLASRPNFTLNPLLHAGVFYVQEAASTAYETIAGNLGFDRPVRAVDLCAAPGGKTTAVLNALPEGSVMLANEYVGSRANILKENLCKYGDQNVVITNSDTSRLSSIHNYFDLVIIDAPCSGEGMMRKEYAARAQWSERLIHQCAVLQREIIDNAIEMLAPGGYLIYSTCTFNTSENEDNAAYIANTYGPKSEWSSNFPDYGNCGMVPVDTGLAGRFGIRPQVKGDIPCLRFMPGFTRGEGLFVAVFKKLNNFQCPMRNCQPTKAGKTHKAEKKGIFKIDPKILSTARSWIKPEMEIRVHDDRLIALSPNTADLLDRIPKDTRIMSAGVEIGELKGKDLIPSHQLAMSHILNSCLFPKVELSKEDALRYLSREAAALPPGIPKGYVAVTFDGFPLGWVKNIGSRSNNLYPADYRIRTRLQLASNHL